MNKITKEAVFTEHEKTPKRRCFSQKTGLDEANKKFSVPIPAAKAVFEQETEIRLYYKPEYDNYWKCYLSSEEIETIKLWERQRGSLVFLRDCLSLSFALDFNFQNSAGNYTQIGLWEHMAKTQGCGAAVKELADAAAQLIQDLPFYKDADCICAVPPAPHKNFDLPSAAVLQISALTGKPNIMGGFSFGGDKNSVKNAALAEKWNIWENARLSFKNDIKGKTVILIDDKYQVGVTLQYIAMKLQEAGVCKIYGLCFVKTWGDQDNRGR